MNKINLGGSFFSPLNVSCKNDWINCCQIQNYVWVDLTQNVGHVASMAFSWRGPHVAAQRNRWSQSRAAKLWTEKTNNFKYVPWSRVT